MVGICLSCGLLPVRASARQSGAAGQVAPESRQHEFVYHPTFTLRSVAVAGEFNNWNMRANPMAADAVSKTWRLTLRLPVGKHLYKFVVNGNTWVADPNAPVNPNDSNGNSVLLIVPADYSLSASPLDGVTALSALQHPMSAPYLNYDREQITLTLRARPNDLSSVSLRLGDRLIPMSVATADDIYAFYSVKVRWDRKRDLVYDFALTDGPKSFDFGATGVAASGSAIKFTVSATTFHPFTAPDWVEKSVMYQIFPDRFANGDNSNDPANLTPWDARPTGDSRFGGDAKGVSDHIPYLADLGISAIYFTPVYKSPSNHRYDIDDYRAVDPQFGTNAEFAALTRRLQDRGIRTVMDFVFNHSSSSFAPFVDVVRNGAASPYRDWYFIHSYPVQAKQPPNYEAFGGWWGMPRLNEANDATGAYMRDVVAFWQKEIPLSGVRLDVADQLDQGFLRKLRTRVKELDRQTWIVGETWGDASQWLGGDQWDAAMNYPFMFACVDYFVDRKTDSAAFANQLMQLYHRYVPQVSRCEMNSLSTHDTPRFLTRCKGNQEMQRLAATLQFTWVGAPCIYYGEELGMEGGADPDNRRGMTWTKVTADNPMLQYYKKLVRLRNRSKALQSGEPATLATNDSADTLAFSRTLGNEIAIVVLNRSDQRKTVTIQLDLKTEYAIGKSSLVDALSGATVVRSPNDTLSVTLEPLHAAVLVQPSTKAPLGALR